MSSLLPTIFNRDPLFRFPNLLQELQEPQNEDRDQGLSIYDEANNIIIEAAMPGVKKEEILINLSKGVLWIKGEKKEEETDKDKKFYKKSLRSFSYSVSLPDQVDETQEPQASYKDGVLKISFQKEKKSQGKRITIKDEITS